jgi:hypothetical protein
MNDSTSSASNFVPYDWQADIALDRRVARERVFEQLGKVIGSRRAHDGAAQSDPTSIAFDACAGPLPRLSHSRAADAGTVR